MQGTPDVIFDGPTDVAWTIALAHGAGAGMDTPFLNTFASGLAGHGIRVARFEFPYMTESRRTGKKRPPDRETVLRETWLKVVELLKRDLPNRNQRRVVIGGKSMGGRIASRVADEADVAGLICLGYPFHPVGKRNQLRVEHLQTIKTPTLIVQGERDPFGHREEVAGYPLSSSVQVKWLEDGDHDFTPRKLSGRTEQQNLETAISEIVTFVLSLSMPNKTRS